MKIRTLLIAALACLSFTCCSQQDKNKISLSSLLDEMVSEEVATLYPSPYYTTSQVSSHDRRSIAPDKPEWFANDDGFGYERMEEGPQGKCKVLFDQSGPGVITRIWMTTSEKTGTLRFYFDGQTEPSITIDGYDMQRFPLAIPDGLSIIHTNYDRSNPQGKGGNTFFLPLPYAKSCKITLEEPDWERRVPRYYQINYRTYDKPVNIETFDMERAAAIKNKIDLTAAKLLKPETYLAGESISANNTVSPGAGLSLAMPEGYKAIRSIRFAISGFATEDYQAIMSGLIVRATFDGVQTVYVPLADFSGAGMGAPKIKCWYMESDGAGNVVVRWVMPYKKSASLELVNNSDKQVDVSLSANVSDWTWLPNTLYFHSNWRFEKNIPLSNDYFSPDCMDWNFATITGRGVYRGDVLSLYNYAPDWWGEGDEKIWIDEDTFPSHFGTGTEDYYNCSWAPVVPFDTPFGGAPRADEPSSHGFNAYVRTRNLDGIPFKQSMRFDIEMLSWNPGTVDFYVTTFWYGDLHNSAKGIINEK